MKDKFCLYCKTKKAKQMYCGRSCANKANAQHLSEIRKGPSNPMYGKKPHNFNGGLTYGRSGSRKVKYQEIRVSGRKIKMHRLIVEKHIGRKLDSKEVVHHKDGNGMNNNIENLQVFSSNAAHRRAHSKGGDAYAGY